MPQATRLFLHADDFGFNASITNGILRCFTEGLLTSTAVLANGPDFSRACQLWHVLLARKMEELPSWPNRWLLGDEPLPFDFGVHLNLTQGSPLTGRAYPAALCDRRGDFPGIGGCFLRLANGGRRYRSAVRAELRSQIEAVLQTGLAVTHLNGHQYIELIPLVGELVLELSEIYAIRVVRVAYETAFTPDMGWISSQFHARALGEVKRYFARIWREQVERSSLVAPQKYFGSLHAGRVDAATLAFFAQAATQKPEGSCEIAWHPAECGSVPTRMPSRSAWHDPLQNLRPQETALMTSSLITPLLKQYPVQLARLSAGINIHG